MKLSVEGKIRMGYGAAFLLLLASFLFSVYTTNELLYHTRWVNRTNKVLHSLEAMLSEIKDVEAAFKGYIVTDDHSLLSYYGQSFNTVDSIYRELDANMQGDVIQSSRLEDISRLVQDEYATIAEGISTYIRDNNVVTDSTKAAIRREQVIMYKIKSKITDMQLSEKALLTLRSERLNNSSGAVKAINMTSLIIAVLLAGYSLITYNKENIAKKAANKRTRAYAEELEDRIAELKRANNELFQLRSIEKFAATGRIARMIAHEVRNPLTNINLACGQLNDAPDQNSSTAMLLETILRNSNRINQMISDLLNSTKFPELRFQKISINNLLDETLEIARDRLQLNDIHVEKCYSPDICEVEVDALKIQIAFMNIIVNGIEAMEPGKGILSVRTETRDGKCVVTITDNGSGIDKESFDKLFEPYFTSKTKGTGLGLTNTQNIILTHKGSIEVETEVGKGTSFSVTLNFAQDG